MVVDIGLILLRTGELAFDDRRHRPNLNGATAWKLAQDHFKKVERFADEQQNDDVRNEKSSAAIFEGRRWKSPNVAQTHRHRNARQQKFDGATPSVSIRWCFLFFLFKKYQKNASVFNKLINGCNFIHLMKLELKMIHSTVSKVTNFHSPLVRFD